MLPAATARIRERYPAASLEVVPLDLGDLSVVSTAADAVLAAHDLFAELNDRLRVAGAAGVSAGRVRVPDPVKLAVIGRAAAGRGRAVAR